MTACLTVTLTASRGDARGLPLLNQAVWGFVFVCFLHLSACFVCFVVFFSSHWHACTCVKTFLFFSPPLSNLCAVVGNFAGNPSASQTKKTIKQRFLKLLPCCKPTAAPSISQSKCNLTLYTPPLPPVGSVASRTVRWSDRPTANGVSSSKGACKSESSARELDEEYVPATARACGDFYHC